MKYDRYISISISIFTLRKDIYMHISRGVSKETCLFGVDNVKMISGIKFWKFFKNHSNKYHHKGLEMSIVRKKCSRHMGGRAG